MKLDDLDAFCTQPALQRHSDELREPAGHAMTRRLAFETPHLECWTRARLCLRGKAALYELCARQQEQAGIKPHHDHGWRF